MQNAASMEVVPVKLTQELENLVNSAFGEDVVHKMPNEKFGMGTLSLLSGSAFRGIRLNNNEN
jgi:hypothetical protein